MISRRVVFAASIIATAISCFTLGLMHARQHELSTRASYDRQLQELRAEVRNGLGAAGKIDAVVPAATSGKVDRSEAPNATSRARMVADIKKQLESEMGLLPVQLLRDRRSSFVELYSYDNFGKTNYG